MLRLTAAVWSRGYRANLKYPSLVSYNKLPWEVIDHQSTALHMHLAPNCEQLLTLAAVTPIANLTLPAHLAVPESERLRVLPGVMYLLGGAAAHTNPEQFTPYRIADPTSLQYYGRIHSSFAPIQRLDLCTSPDLRLLCLALHFEGLLRTTTERSSLAEATAASADGRFSFFFYFRPNRPANELTRPFEKFYQHRLTLDVLEGHLSSPRGTVEAWSPVLQIPRRTGGKARLTPAEPYQPPRTYLMGLAERLAVRPGSCFGRRSLMWGTWF